MRATGVGEERAQVKAQRKGEKDGARDVPRRMARGGAARANDARQQPRRQHQFPHEGASLVFDPNLCLLIGLAAVCPKRPRPDAQSVLSPPLRSRSPPSLLRTLEFAAMHTSRRSPSARRHERHQRRVVMELAGWEYGRDFVAPSDGSRGI